MNTLVTDDYIIFILSFIFVSEFFSGREHIDRVGLSVLRQKMRLKKFQNLKL